MSLSLKYSISLLVFIISTIESMGRVAQSEKRLTTGWTVRGSKKRLRWSRGLRAGLWNPRLRVRSRPKPSDFS
jgi:hypothetical protein